MILMYHLAAYNGLIADPEVNFSMGYSLIGFILLTLTVNIGFIIFKTIETWRHKKAVDSSRSLVVKQMTELSEKSNLIDMKKSKQQLRNDFILKKMTQAVPINESVPAESKNSKKKKSQPETLCMEVIGESCHEWSERDNQKEIPISKPSQMESYDDWDNSLH